MSSFVSEKLFPQDVIFIMWQRCGVNQHGKTVGIDPNNDSNYDSRHQSMTMDFDPFWKFKMIGDPLLLIGDPQKILLVTPW